MRTVGPDTTNMALAPRQAGASGIATLSDTTIRKVRIGIMISTGLASLLIGTAQLSFVAHDDAWERINGFAYLGTSVGCFTALALSLTRWLKLSEIAMLLTAYLGTAGVVVTGPSDSAVVVGASAYSLVILLPGLMMRIRSRRTSAINLAIACLVYIACMFLRVILHGDRSVGPTFGDLIAKALAPPLAYIMVWFMVRAVYSRVLEALAESERSRNALRITLDRQVALNDALVRFVPQEFLTSLGRHDISEVRLGDSVTRPMSILFADIYGYTRLVEGMTPAATIEMLNELFGALEPAIHDHGGFIDSYIGDAVMALFDGPPSNAIDAAIAMLHSLARHNEARGAEGRPPIALGIGINTGVVTLGTNGGAKRLKCSVFGDSVNLAARIEHLTRRYETPLLVSEHTLEHLADRHAYIVRAVDRVRVVGRSHTTTLFEIYDADPEPRRARKRLVEPEYAAGLAAFYERRFAEALATFERCLAVHDDVVLRSYAERSRALLASPPDITWTGVEVLTQK